jgi:hypothetical protein
MHKYYSTGHDFLQKKTKRAFSPQKINRTILRIAIPLKSCSILEGQDILQEVRYKEGQGRGLFFHTGQAVQVTRQNGKIHHKKTLPAAGPGEFGKISRLEVLGFSF